MIEKLKIAELLDTHYVGRKLFCFEKLSSTNDFLKDSADSLPDGCAVAANEQTAGKGRRGHVWATPKGETAAFSFLLKSALPACAPPVTLICGFAAAKAIGGLCGADFYIKWPNDIVCSGKKVCGILCEAKLSGTGCNTVCGIGINLTQSKEYFTKAGLPNATSLKSLTGRTIAPEQAIAAVLNRFERIYSAVARGGEAESARFLSEYCAACVTLKKEICAKTPGGELRGIARSVNADGTLSVLCGDRTVTLNAGEVSVRGIMGYV